MNCRVGVAWRAVVSRRPIRCLVAKFMKRNRRENNTRSRPRLAIVVPVILLSAVSLGVAADWWFAIPADAQATYVGRQTCVECHQQQVEDWTGSDHDLAMDLASDESVLGDFNDAEFTYQGVTSKMFRRDGKFFINTEGPDGKLADFEIKYTFGVRPLQQYMVEFPDGRVQVLRVSWDTARKKWFYVPPPDVLDEKIEPGDPLHWTGAAQNWNHTCADCHSTNLQKNYDLATDRYHTTYSEIDVSCEACHGPASMHVELARSTSLFWDRHHGYGLAKLKGQDTRPQIETCAKCHSRRNVVHGDFSPGGQLLDFYEPELLQEGVYHADGQIQDEVYVHGSFLQSKMFHKGVRCTDCHNPHSLKLKFDGNKLCAQCHQPGKYDTPAHHHHQPGTAGASCVECHMPATTYMVVDPRRDHSLRIPRPDLSVDLGTPNACNNCHTKPEEDAQWAADQVVEWYGDQRPDDPHYARALTAARENAPDAEDQLVRLIRRPATPDIVLATAATLLARYDSTVARQTLSDLLTHASPLVRTTAARVYSAGTPGETLGALEPLLDDPVRSVRIAAARSVAGLPRNLLTSDQREKWLAALDEYKQSQLASSDRAGAHLNLGNLYQELSDTDRAVQEFRTAIRLEPYLTGARSNLATLLEQSGGDPAEVEQLRQGELKLLARDAELLPENAGVRHRYGLTLYLTGHMKEAERELEAAVRLAPDNADFRMVLTLLYERLKKWDAAMQSVVKLKQLRPEDPAVDQVAKRIQISALRDRVGQ